MTRPGSGVATPQSYCVVVADATRARVLVLEAAEPEAARAGGERAASGGLIEITELTNPVVRARPAAPSGRGPAGAELSRASAHRDRGAAERDFAAEIAEEAAAAWTVHAPCALILVAPPSTLAALRAAVDDRCGGPIDPTAVHELARDLVRLDGARLYDELAGVGLIPATGHPAPIQPAGGLWR